MTVQSSIPRTPQEWFESAQRVYQDFLEALSHYGITPSPELKLIPAAQANPYYEPATLTIGVGMPDASTIQGKLYWLYVSRLLGLEGIDQAIAMIYDQLPLLICHELTHHLRHHYHAPISNDFIEEQVSNIVALSFIAQHPRYRATIPRLKALADRGSEKFASLSPETVSYLPGYRLDIADVIVAKGDLSPAQLDQLRTLASELGENLDQLIIQGQVISGAALKQAEAAQEESQNYFNRTYSASYFEYAFFFNEWLRNYLERDELPSLGQALETYILTQDWERTRTQETATLLTAMLWHPNEEVAEAAVESLSNLLEQEAAPMLLNALDQERPGLQAAILRTLAQLGCKEPELIALAETLLQTPDPAVQSGAAIVLLKAGGAAAPLGRARLSELLTADAVTRQITLSNLAGLRDLSLLPLLASCLGSLVGEVRARALQCMARLPARALISRMAATALSDPEDAVRREAVRCLRAHATSATLPLLIQLLDDPSSPVRQDATEALHAHDKALPRLSAVQGRWRARSELAMIAYQRNARRGGQQLRALIAELVRAAHQLTAQRVALELSSGLRRFLYQALGEERAKLVGLMLRLAGVLGNQRAMDLALRGLSSERPEVRAPARELARGAIPPDLLAALEIFLSEDLDRAALQLVEQRPPRLNDLLLYGNLFLRQVTEAVVTADQVPAGSDLPTEVEAMLTTIEKLMFLRAVPAFQGIALEDLRPLAEQTTAQTFHAGEYIFTMGDDGDTMYIITMGRVAIEYDRPAGKDVPIASLGPGQYFGEMALFDGKPRSASAVALEDLCVLALERDPFLRLGTRQPRILIEVLRVLSNRLRQLVEDIG